MYRDQMEIKPRGVELQKANLVICVAVLVRSLSRFLMKTLAGGTLFVSQKILPSLGQLATV